MPHVDDSLRRALIAEADGAGPLTLSPGVVATRVRRRRRRTAVMGVVASVVMVLGAAVGMRWVGSEPDSAAMTPAPAPSYPRPFVCGEPAAVGPDAGSSRLGLTMALSRAARVNDSSGPLLEITYTADRALAVRDSPPTHYEVLYVRDGVIVGGGPMLNSPGDLTGQAMPLPGSGFDVRPGQPALRELGPRDRLCPGLEWSQVWAQHQRYEVIVVQGRVFSMGDDPQRLIVDIPALGYWPLLVARAPLGQ